MSDSKLYWCNHCNERSARIKIYTKKGDDRKKRVLYCINKGCGWKVEIPFPEDFVSNTFNSLAGKRLVTNGQRTFVVNNSKKGDIT